MSLSEHPSSTDVPFADECRDILQNVRAALIEALGAAGVDASHPREAARILGLDKNLVWRVSKIVGQPDVFQAVGSLPHKAGFGILARALAGAGVAPPLVERLIESHRVFEALVERHAGDRATFELLVAAFGRDDYRAQVQEQGRKLAYRGNCAVWAVQSRMHVCTAVLSPNADDPSMVDLTHVFGVVDLVRLRDDVRWTLCRHQLFDDAATNLRKDEGQPLDPGGMAAGFPLIRAFSSDPFPEVSVVEQSDRLHYVLSEGRVGRTGELSVFFGARYPALGSRYKGGGDELLQLVTNLLTPAEHLHLDLLAHEDLDFAMNPSVALLGGLDGRDVHMASGYSGTRIPVEGSVVDLGSGLTGTATPLMPQYGELLSWIFERVGHDPARFRVFRYELAYPPMPARAILYSELEQPPAPGAST